MEVEVGGSWLPPEQTGTAAQTAAAVVTVVAVAVDDGLPVNQQCHHLRPPETAVLAAVDSVAADGHQALVREQGPHWE